MSPFIVCEMSANHLGNLKRALQIVEAAKEAGADAIKVQTWTPGTMCLDTSIVLDHGPWKGKRLVDLYEQAFLPWEWHHRIFNRARALGMVPFSAAFDWQAVDFLETLGVDRHKVASFELTDLPLIRYMRTKKKPIIISCGMATQQEIFTAINATGALCRWALKCTSAYPADASQCNIRTMVNMRDFASSWPVEAPPMVGLSDHTLGHEAATAATALGATYIEKHLTLSRADGGPDAGFSSEPAEFAAMVQAVRRTTAMLGEVKYGPTAGEDPSLRRSLWVRYDISAGQPLRFGDNVVTARPALGLPCDTVLTGTIAARALKAGTPLRLEDIA